jgi:hypothetical protein
MRLVDERMDRLREVKYEVEELFGEVVGRGDQAGVREDSCFY